MTGPEAIAAAERLLKKITPGPWRIWEGPGYVGGGEDLCIGAGETWLSNMDHRSCQNHAHHIGCHVEGCRLQDDADVCSFSEAITVEQRANAEFIAAAPELVATLCSALLQSQEALQKIAERGRHGYWLDEDGPDVIAKAILLSPPVAPKER